MSKVVKEQEQENNKLVHCNYELKQISNKKYVCQKCGGIVNTN